ncbi:MAG: hypothetical protein AAFO02_00585 [Bacteroidota bacterium]
MKKSQAEISKEIKAHISRLHDRNSGDYQSLMQQVNRANRLHTVELNLPQAYADLAGDRMFRNEAGQLQGISTYCEWGRGTGKTTMRGIRWKKKLRQLPRSTGLFIGPNYQMILTRVVPSLVQGLELFGLYEGLHYFIGQQPPPKWRPYWGKAYQPPKKYNRYITFFNGMGAHLISHDVKGDGRGLNTDWIDGDEAALLDPNALQENSGPTKRGTNTAEFYGKPMFGAEFYTSSTPLDESGQWFVNMEEQAVLNPKRIKFISATCRHNLHNLRPGYLEDAQLNAYSEWKYLAEYENVRPMFSKNGFYGLLNPQVHYYSMRHDDYDFYKPNREQLLKKQGDCREDADLIAGMPLIGAADWGAAINAFIANQYVKSENEFRALKDFYTLGENRETQDDLADNVAEYYKYHNCKEMYLYYDNTGNNKTGNTKKTRAEQFRDRMKGHGWKVYLMTVGGSNPLHELKHYTWQEILKEEKPWLPKFRINKWNCADTCTSMRFAKTKPGRNGEIKKDKSSERSKKIARQHATDLSDAIDQPIFSMFRHQVQRQAVGLPGVRFG